MLALLVEYLFETALEALTRSPELLKHRFTYASRFANTLKGTKASAIIIELRRFLYYSYRDNAKRIFATKIFHADSWCRVRLARRNL